LCNKIENLWVVACRRYVSNASLFNRVTEVASRVPGTKLVIGGNAPVMVNSILREEGVRVLLGAEMTENLRMQISPDVEGKDLFCDHYSYPSSTATT